MRINKIEKRVETLEKVTTDVVHSLQQLQRGIRLHKKVDIAVGLMTAILNAMSFGVVGSATQGILGTALNSIVDFGDLSHIQCVVESFADVSIKNVFEAALNG
eukprot:9515632-Ditylum_brightwellii.AAC.1